MNTSQRYEFDANLSNKEMFIGREDEIDRFNQQFDELLKGKSNLIMVDGVAGIGKTYLVERAIKQLPANTLLYGKSQQYHTGALTVVSQILNQIINHILTLQKASMYSLSQELKSKVGEDLALLASISTGISKLFDTTNLREIEDFSRRNYRAKNAVFRFLQCTSRTFFPMVIYLDDVQWADQFSFDIIKTLVKKRHLLNTLLVISYRGNELHRDRERFFEAQQYESCYIPLKKVDFSFVKAYFYAVVGQKIKGENQIITLLYRLSAGNPFYIKEIMRIWIEVGVISYSEKKESPEVISRLINNYTLSDSIEAMIIERIRGLEQNENHFLETLACLGGKADYRIFCEIIGIPEPEIEKQIDQLVNAAVVFISSHYGMDKEICFSHDIIYRLINSRMNVRQKQSIYYSIAKTVMEKELPVENKETFLASYLLQIPKTKIQEETDIWMHILLTAGIHEMKTAGIENALAIFEYTINMIPFCKHLSREYIVLINLEYAEILCLYKRFEESEGIIKTLLEDPFNKDFFIQIQKKKMYIHHYKREHKATIQVGAELLNAMGVKFNRQRFIIDYIKCARIYTTRKINEIHMTSEAKDERISEIIDTLILMNSSAAVINDNIRASVALTAALMSAKDPGTSNALMGYAAYSYVLLIRSNRREKTKLLIDAIKTMIAKTEDSTSKPTVYLLLGAFLSHWTHPLAESAQHLQKGMEISEQLGDFQFLGYCNYAKLDTMEIMGAPLTDIQEYIKKSREAFSEIEQYVTTYHFELYEAHVAALRDFGQNANETNIKKKYPMVAPSECYIEEILLLQRQFLFGQKQKAYTTVQRILSQLEFSKTYIFRIDILLFTVCTFASVYIDLGSKEQKAAQRVSKRFLNELKLIAFYQSKNYYSYYTLAEAEYKTHIMKDEHTIGLYNDAIKSARENGNIKMEALGNQLAARNQQDNNILSAFYAKEAVRLFRDWGADAFADRLTEKFQIVADFKIPDAEVSFSQALENRKMPIETFAHQLEKKDEKAAVVQFFDMMIKNGYADYCAVLVEKDDELFLKYQKNEGNSLRVYKDLVNINHLPSFPHKMLRYVERTSEEVVLEAATGDALFGSDTYIKENPHLSLACFPLKQQRVFFGAVYFARCGPAISEQDRVYIKGLIQTVSNKIGEASEGQVKRPREKQNSNLTKREIEILKLVKCGFSNDEVSGKLSITLGTVKIHMNNILRKLDSDSRIKAIIAAEEQNII